MAWRVVYPGPRVKMGLHTVKAPPVSDKVAEGELQGEEEAASDEAPGVDSGGNSRNSANKVNNRSNGVWVNGGGPEP